MRWIDRELPLAAPAEECHAASEIPWPLARALAPFRAPSRLERATSSPESRIALRIVLFSGRTWGVQILNATGMDRLLGLTGSLGQGDAGERVERVAQSDSAGGEEVVMSG